LTPTKGPNPHGITQKDRDNRNCRTEAPSTDDSKYAYIISGGELKIRLENGVEVLKANMSKGEQIRKVIRRYRVFKSQAVLRNKQFDSHSFKVGCCPVFLAVMGARFSREAAAGCHMTRIVLWAVRATRKLSAVVSENTTYFTMRLDERLLVRTLPEEALRLPSQSGWKWCVLAPSVGL
jgi:hypothetical protein